MKKHIIFLQNIIAPYRIALFNDLENLIKELSIAEQFSFSVYIMRITEANRKWKINEEDLHFDYYIDNGFYKFKYGYHWHLNFNLIKKILKSEDHEIILGGSWNNLNILLVVILKRLGILKNKLHIWSEANYLSKGAKNDNYFKKYLRKFVFNSIDGDFLIPGKMPLLTFEKWRIFPATTIYFPNLINQEFYSISDIDLFKRKKNIIPIFLIVAGLKENIKGIVNYLSTIGNMRLKSIEVKIAGDGPDKDMINEFLIKNELTDNVILLGNLDSTELLNQYRNCNVFVLPSFSDQSPLSVVEAISMELPILISNRCGNHYEALEDGINGYMFDPYNSESIVNTFDKLIERRKDWKDMGTKSKMLALKNFNNKSVLKEFISKICC